MPEISEYLPWVSIPQQKDNLFIISSVLHSDEVTTILADVQSFSGYSLINCDKNNGRA